MWMRACLGFGWHSAGLVYRRLRPGCKSPVTRSIHTAVAQAVHAAKLTIIEF